MSARDGWVACPACSGEGCSAHAIASDRHGRCDGNGEVPPAKAANMRANRRLGEVPALPDCTGTRFETCVCGQAAIARSTCALCDGSGLVNSINGDTRSCPACNGTGEPSPPPQAVTARLGHLEGPDNATWRMGDGTRVFVRDMENTHLFNTIFMIERRWAVMQVQLAQEARKRGEGYAQDIAIGTLWPSYDVLMVEVRRRGLNARLDKERADREDGAVLAAALEQGTREEAPPAGRTALDQWQATGSAAPTPRARRVPVAASARGQCQATIQHSTYGLIRCGLTEQHAPDGHRWKGKRTWRVDVYEQLPDSHRGECVQWFWHAPQAQPQAQQTLPLDAMTRPKPQPEPADAPDARFSRLEIDDETGSLAERKRR